MTDYKKPLNVPSLPEPLIQPTAVLLRYIIAIYVKASRT